MANDLVARVLSRASNPETIHDMARGLSPAPQIAPRASLQQLATAEDRLGFGLPALLKQIYAEIGNGGFGPGYGLLGLDELLQSHEQFRQQPGWPKGMIPLCTWGCGIYSFTSCLEPMTPVFVYSLDMHVLDGHGVSEITITSEDGETVSMDVPEPKENKARGNVSLPLHKPSLEEWVEAWVEGKDLWAEMELL